MGVPATDLAQLSLPPGFRFYPTDEELLVQYLCRKVAGHQFNLQIIAEIDLYKFDPWDLPSKALFGEKEWYFFSPLDRKYPNGSRPNRVAGSGYWKATGTDKVIATEGRRVGIKKALVFYIGKAPKGTKTNWIMHEYRLLESSHKVGSSKLDEWVLCRIYKKNASSENNAMSVIEASTSSKEHVGHASSPSSSSLYDMLDTFPDMDDRFFSLPRVNSLEALQQHHDQKPDVNSLRRLSSGCFDYWAAFTDGLNPRPELNQAQAQTINYNQNDVYVPGMAVFGSRDSARGHLGNSAEEEVQSRPQGNQGGATTTLQHGMNLPSLGFPNTIDSYGMFRYSPHPSGFEFQQ